MNRTNCVFRTFRTIALAGVACLALPAPAAVVFNNTMSPTGQVNELLASGQTISLEHGNQITLAGGERIVTNFTTRLRILGAGPATFTVQIRFHKNDGVNGAPGTPLWDSGFLTRVIDSGADISYSFPVPNVRVPSTFTWSIRIWNRQGNMAMMGPAEYNPPTVGSVGFGYWRNFGFDTPQWQFTNPQEPPFSARVDANAIPGDVDVNGFVNVNDLLAVINAWGSCANCRPGACPADVNGDCMVNINDLLIVINNWG